MKYIQIDVALIIYSIIQVLQKSTGIYTGGRLLISHILCKKRTPSAFNTLVKNRKATKVSINKAYY